MSESLPQELEICTRPVNAQPCGRRLFRMGPERTPYCEKCGATEPGVLYIRKRCDCCGRGLPGECTCSTDADGKLDCNPGFHDGEPV